MLSVKLFRAWCLAGSAGALATAVDVVRFIIKVSPEGQSHLTDPLQLGKVGLIGGGFVMLAGLLALLAWQTGLTSSEQRALVAHWSLPAVTLWAGISAFLLLVYYPLPPHKHHLDKLLLILGLLLGWSLGLAAKPAWVAAVLASRGYAWLRVGVINLLVFIAVGEALAQGLDAYLGRHGLFGAKHTPASLKPYREVSGSIGRSNAQGFRDRERSMARTGPAPRVIVLGDSFVWGIGVSYDETFVTLLERDLQQTHPGAEVINLGVPGFEPDHYFHLLTRYGMGLTPDVVVLALYVGNDIMRRRGADAEDAIVVAGQSYYVHRNGNWVHDHLGGDRWYLYHDLNYLLRVGLARLERWLDRPPSGGGFTRAGAAAAVRRRSAARTESVPVLRTHPAYLRDIDERSEIYWREDTDAFRSHWRQTEAVLTAMVEYLASRGVPLLVVLISDQVQHDGALMNDYLAAVGASPERYDFDKPQRMLNDWCTRRAVRCLDLLASFRSEPEARRLYLVDDPHWSAAGHVLAAQTILPVLREQLDRRGVIRSVAEPKVAS
jgi:hypothetical protein